MAATLDVVLQVLPGVAPALVRELGRALPGSVPDVIGDDDPALADEVRVRVPRTAASVAALHNLRCAVSASIVVTSPAPRPTGLVATEVLREVAQAWEAIAWQRPRARFSGLRLEAAGADTPQMRRVAQELASLVGVPVDDEDGDLVIRVRRAQGPGWEMLLRTTSRPLATRAWRTERYPGALNATIAAAVVDELGVSPDDTFADLACGSGTLVIERLARGPARRVLAADASPEAVSLTARHLRGARVRGRVAWRPEPFAEVGRAPEDAAAFSVIVCNPPWGELHGDHATNDVLHADLLDAIDRLGTGDVVAGVLTHDVRRFARALEQDPRWRVEAAPRFFAKGHRPTLFVVRRA